MNYTAQCPSCEHEFFTAIADARAGLICPKCNIGFIPSSLIPQSVSPELPNDSDIQELLIEARNADRSSVGSFVLGILLSIAAFFVLLAQGSVWVILAGIGTFFFCLSLWFTLIKHLIHIRIALENRNLSGKQ